MKWKRKRWPLADQGTFLQKTGELLSKGYRMKDVLLHMQPFFDHRYDQQLQHASLQFEQGASFLHVMQHMHFHPHVQSFLQMPHSQNTFPNVLKNCGLMMTKWSMYQRQLLQIIRYPLIMGLFFIAFLVVLQMYILPLFEGLTTGEKNPYLELLPSLMFQGIQLIGCLIAFSAIAYLALKRFATPVQQINLYLRLPLFKRWLRYYLTYYFCSQLSILFASGCSAREAFTILTTKSNTPFFQEECKRIYEQLTAGERLEEVIAQRPYYDPSLAAVIVMGQLKGDLHQQLDELSANSFEQMDRMLKSVVARTQPILFAMLGLFVFLLFLSVMLPVFQLMNSI
ncbi:type II secretion system F family protein [Aureibacillus halotolerans]|uniref:Competence-related pilin export protein ComGB n=1 Tax=Aureibacillus halotolerans TaxID=1508390 RepID=A0A4R6U5D3_9BACI|nr:type II secretion system F family protein [Aureibacillus halotolerans]TDQ41678.1 competence-related pilin export protein ComGB [Aureibacillus halotolerans]